MAQLKGTCGTLRSIHTFCLSSFTVKMSGLLNMTLCGVPPMLATCAVLANTLTCVWTLHAREHRATNNIVLAEYAGPVSSNVGYT